jgi:hypothetical protein
LSGTLAALEALDWVAALRASRWAYPLVNAGHILGIALLVGAVVPLDLRILGAWRSVPLADVTRILRPVAATGLVLALATGAALFAVAAREYAGTALFQAKMGVVALAGLNAAAALRWPGRLRAAASLGLWPLALISGRFLGYL